MPICPKCGEENPERARFCLACAAPLAAPAAERRKPATLLFCDLSGSTSMGERIDAESVRELMSRYFDEMRGCIERHGGTVEKFAGDAVMAVFGVPQAHEDDALRAVRAAAEMRERLAELNPELERRFGTRLSCRIGINTGEVVAGDPSAGETFVTGDPVNTAARLEQAARPGEILLGEETYRLAAAFVQADEAAPVQARGKAEPVAAYRLRSVETEVAPRAWRTPLVGRGEELAMFERAFQQTRSEHRCLLVTLVGEAGVGKSRLAEEFVGRVSDRARVLRGRCLSYGEGITYWPVSEIVREGAGIRDEDAPEQARARIARILEPRVADPLAAAIGLGGSASPEEIAWALRRLFETLATAEGALVVFVEDLHWAEEVLLDLLLHVATRSEAPILLLTTARRDLLERRSDWPAVAALEPLGESRVSELIRRLLPEAAPELRARVLERAGGNPLFAEELAALVAADGEESLPTTLNALLAARLDRLSAGERASIEQGSVEGEVFHLGAVRELSAPSDHAEVPVRLRRLVGTELIEPTAASFAGETAFRFRHVLVRDAAYRQTAKKLRAELHERFADWLERIVGLRIPEYEEILGYHLECSVRYRTELGSLDDKGAIVARRAAERLASAGAGAASRGDMGAAANLLSRAQALLLDDDPQRLELLLQLGFALTGVGELARAEAALQEAVELAHATGDLRLEWRSRLEGAIVRVWRGGTMEECLDAAEQAIGVFEKLADDAGLARAWHIVGFMRFWGGQAGPAEDAWDRSLAHGADPREEAETLSWLLIATWFGPTAVRKGLRRCRDVMRRSAAQPKLEAFALLESAPLEAMLGHFDEARTLLHRGKAILDDLGLKIAAGGASQEVFDVEMLAGNPEAAEHELRQACEMLEEMGEMGFLSTRAASLAQALYVQGEYEEAERFTHLSEERGASDDIHTQSAWRSVRAKVLARRGEAESAEELAREAVRLASSTDWLNHRGETLLDLAEVLTLRGKEKQAVALVEEAARLFGRKGNVVSADRARKTLVEFGVS